jgi:hypothetical protein
MPPTRAFFARTVTRTSLATIANRQYTRPCAKREFAALWRAEAKQVPRGRAWYLYRFAITDLSIRMAPFG